MADALHLRILTLAHAFSGVAGVLVPVSGSGPITCSAIVRPEKDEVADFPELRGFLGAERPGWELNFDQRDLLVRPVAGDRWTDADGRTFQLRIVRSDVLGIRWFCTGFLVEADAVAVDDAFMLPIYFAGIQGLGL